MSGNVVQIDNTSKNDNWITNNSGQPVTVACKEPYGSFAVHLKPGETKRITYDVKANVYPMGQYTYDDLKYKLDKRENWEVLREDGTLILKKM